MKTVTVNANEIFAGMEIGGQLGSMFGFLVVGIIVVACIAAIAR